MELNDIYNSTDPNESYTIYNDDGQLGAVTSDETPPENSTTIATDVSGSTIRQDARKGQKNLFDTISQPEQNAQEQEETIEEQYYSYLTNGASSSTNLCKA